MQQRRVKLRTRSLSQLEDVLYTTATPAARWHDRITEYNLFTPGNNIHGTLVVQYPI